ncbi:MAG: 3-oxoacyl-[acyl-carrier-protein] synthase [Solirubrobacteraceae bacterium]|jgi:3-oxoacyl-[acyl-carrier-protein] synthase-3|nr:3-oxoacyl-[acyl-carrier-protein] synthase [Solirubrobacteraceae bacterium]
MVCSVNTTTRELSSSFPALGPSPTRAGAAVASVGVSLPATVVFNAEIGARLGVGEDWIERRTGIRARHVADPEERLASHATVAARRALDRAGVDAIDVDLVLVATTTADEVLPNAAPLVAFALGASRAGAFDVGAACTGFLSALAVGSAQIESGRATCVLVVGADFMSRITDPDDRATAAVFADGAGAVVLVATDEPSRIGPVVLGADGMGAENIVVGRTEALIRMRGHETFREAVARLSESTLAATEASEVALDEIDLFVYHQANGRILSAVGERLGLTPERVVDCIGEYGNTSAATLPLALAFSEQRGLLEAGHRVLLGAFGAGFTWGAVVAEWGAG